MDTRNIIIHPEVFRLHNPDTRFSHFDGTDEELKQVVLRAWRNGNYRRVRNGVYEVKVNPEKFFCRVMSSDKHHIGWVKPPARTVFVLVNLTQNEEGRISGLIVFEMQAWVYEKPPKVNFVNEVRG